MANTEQSGLSAEAALRQAVERDPTRVQAWIALAEFLAQRGRTAEAEQAFQSAAAAAPDQPYPLFEHARYLAMLGRLSEAEGLADRAERLCERLLSNTAQSPNPQLVALRSELSGLLADIHLKAGRMGKALGYLEQAVLLGAAAPVQTLFLSLLFQVTFSQARPSLKPILTRALEEGWADPAAIGRLGARLLMFEPEFQRLAQGEAAILSATPSPALTDPLLLTILERTVVVDPDLERLLVKLRRALLNAVTDPAQAGVDPGVAPFALALASQGFANEYAYAVSQAEQQALDALVQRSRSQLAEHASLDPLDLAVIAAYGPLYRLLDTDALLARNWPGWFRPLITRQIVEPLDEQALGRQIPTATAVRDAGSRAVKDQYEENPFPRWIAVPRPRPPESLWAWIGRNYPAADPALAPPAARRATLVAGCGTGQETATLAQMLSDVDILAIDLSRASLAHALRKSRELGLLNVDFACADLLEVQSLERRFDFVVSAGVLHHLDDPVAGWRALKEVTVPGGVMLIALYSTLGRRRLAEARAFTEAGGYGVAADDLRRFRAAVLDLAPSPDMAWRDDLLNRDDFYTLSTLRDLVFHVRETCFDVERIASALDELGLRFCGFQTSAEIGRRFQARFGRDADPLSLAQWRVFETENPDTFWHMYHFLVQRV